MQPPRASHICAHYKVLSMNRFDLIALFGLHHHFCLWASIKPKHRLKSLQNFIFQYRFDLKAKLSALIPFSKWKNVEPWLLEHWKKEINFQQTKVHHIIKNCQKLYSNWLSVCNSIHYQHFLLKFGERYLISTFVETTYE